MPALTRWFLRSALVYLVVSLCLGVLVVMPSTSGVAALVPVSIHLFMVGWVTQMIFGVAYWMFPRLAGGKPHGSERLGVLTYVALNAGLMARAVAEPMLSLRAGGPWAVLLVLSGALQWLGAVVFVVNTWPRVKVR